MQLFKCVENIPSLDSRNIVFSRAVVPTRVDLCVHGALPHSLERCIRSRHIPRSILRVMAFMAVSASSISQQSASCIAISHSFALPTTPPMLRVSVEISPLLYQRFNLCTAKLRPGDDAPNTGGRNKITSVWPVNTFQVREARFTF